MENRSLTVFIVDDEKLIRDGMKKLLKWEENGFQICGEAANGRDALREILFCMPDIVLTDLRMPAMDGLALTAALREQAPTVEVVIITGYDEFEYAKEAVRNGVFDYLLKPVSHRELLETMLRLKHKIHSRSVGYPFEEEERLLQSIRENDGDMGVRTLDVMFDRFKAAMARQTEVYKICNKILTEVDIAYKAVYGPKALAVKPEPPKDATVQELEMVMRDYLSKIFHFGSVDSSDLLVEKLKQYLDTHYQENVSLKMLEDEFFFNASYISRIFKIKTGENYSDYLLRLRICRAKELLTTSNYSIRQISEMVGFGSSKYFSKVFKDMEGVQPITYRNEVRQDGQKA
ncbi:MAG: response regulator [Oscillospiraceae bacterium]|nr:response regulator [Oscillospiraceae bacterium]